MTTEQLRAREAFEKLVNEWVGAVACNGSLSALAAASIKDAWNTRADSGEAVAWMAEDGRVISKQAHASGKRVGGAPLSAISEYPVPLFAHPIATEEESRKAVAFDALVAAGFVTQEKAQEAIELANAIASREGEGS